LVIKTSSQYDARSEKHQNNIMSLKETESCINFQLSVLLVYRTYGTARCEAVAQKRKGKEIVRLKLGLETKRVTIKFT
jgi:hypothetical protein